MLHFRRGYDGKVGAPLALGILSQTTLYTLLFIQCRHDFLMLSFPMNTIYPHIAYHQYVARPITRPITSNDLTTSQSTDDTPSNWPLRSHLRINHPDVNNFVADILWDEIAETLVEPDENAPGSSRSFVLVVIGDIGRDRGSTLYNSIFHF